MNITGTLRRFDGQTLWIQAPFTDGELLSSRQVESCTVILDDGRTLTAKQRRFIYALLRDVSYYTGHETEFLKDYFKAETLARTGGCWFSLRDCSMTEANELIDTLIQFCVEWRVPTMDNLIDFAPDIDRYIFWCLKYKVCCITRQEGAELHHVDHIGMGRDRHEIPHIGLRAMPLLRKYHEEAHRTGQKTFEEKYHIHGIPLTAELCQIWNLKEGT